MTLFPFHISASSKKNSEVESIQKTNHDFLKPLIWSGFELGYALSSPDNVNKELEKSGFHYNINSKLGLDFSKFSIDIGLGFAQTNLIADGDPTSLIESQIGSKEQLEIGEIATSYATASIETRFKLNSLLEIGPLITMPFGVDTSFGPTIEEDSLPNLFLGGRVLLNLNKPSYKDRLAIRAGVSYMTDLTIDERQIHLFNVYAQVGFLLGKKPNVVVKTKVKYRTKVVKKILRIVNDKYIIDAGIINFATGSYKISTRKQAYLEALSKFLNTNKSAWDKVHITSHTDVRGSVELNKKLSRKRAEEISKIFFLRNTPKNKIKIESRTFKLPVEQTHSKISFAKNRRVEITISGGKKMPDLKQSILRLQQKFRMPSNCNSQGTSCQ